MPPAPKDPELRQRRNKPSSSATIDAAGARKPALGRHRSDGGEWAPETRRWWAAIWSSRIVERWRDAHVPGLLRLARMVDDYWHEADALRARQIHAEIRMVEREYGLTPMAGRSLGWTFSNQAGRDPAPDAPKLPPGADPRKVLSIGTRRAG